MGFDFLDQIRMERETVGTRPYTSIYEIETTDSTRMTVTYPPDTDSLGRTTTFTLPHVDDIKGDRLALPPPLQFFTFTLRDYYGTGKYHDSNEFCYGVRPNNSHWIYAIPRRIRTRRAYQVNPDYDGIDLGRSHSLSSRRYGFGYVNPNIGSTITNSSAAVLKQDTWPGFPFDQGAILYSAVNNHTDITPSPLWSNKREALVTRQVLNNGRLIQWQSLQATSLLSNTIRLTTRWEEHIHYNGLYIVASDHDTVDLHFHDHTDDHTVIHVESGTTYLPVHVDYVETMGDNIEAVYGVRY